MKWGDGDLTGRIGIGRAVKQKKVERVVFPMPLDSESKMPVAMDGLPKNTDGRHGEVPLVWDKQREIFGFEAIGG
jgi:hypothetical protein